MTGKVTPRSSRKVTSSITDLSHHPNRRSHRGAPSDEGAHAVPRSPLSISTSTKATTAAATATTSCGPPTSISQSIIPSMTARCSGSFIKRKKNATESLRALQRDKDEESNNTSRRHVHIANILVSMLLFVVLAGAGITVYTVMAKARQAGIRNGARQTAVEFGDWFAKELDLAILPLFSMAQFATELDQFVSLPTAIEPRSFVHDDALDVKMRNVTGICNDPALIKKYNHIAAAIKNSSRMDGVLHNIQLSPQGVLCLAYPLNNTEDFLHTDRPDKFLDVSPSIGLDMLNEPKLMYIARSTMAHGEVGIAGPRPLLQCADCGLYFIVRLPVHSTTHEIDVDGKLYPRWGFATALINWDALVTRSNVHDHFQALGFSFQLTRTDHSFDDTTKAYSSNVVILAESEDFGAADSNDNNTWRATRRRGQVETALQTTNNEWVMTVVYNHGEAWVPCLAIFATLVVAFFVSCLIYIVLMQRQAHADVQGTAMAQEAKVEIERHMTAYFAHELRNPLSAIDSALSVLQEKGTNRNDDPESADIVAGMQLCTSFMSSIMNNLLDSRKLEEGQMVLKKNPLSLEGLVKDVRQMMAPAVQPGVELLVSVERNKDNTLNDERNGDWVFGDVHRLQQVLTNVTSNSIKFTRTGSITLVVAGWEGDLVRLECRDTGAWDSHR